MHYRKNGSGTVPGGVSAVVLSLNRRTDEPGINIENGPERLARTPEKFTASKTPRARQEPEKKRPERREILREEKSRKQHGFHSCMLETQRMKKVRITILKTTFDSELAKEFGMIGLGPCPLMKAGAVYYADYAKPEGFCDEAWKAIYQYVFALAHGAGENLFYYGDWIRKPGVAIVSCNDGLRPVIMKLEATDIPSEPPKPAESREQSIEFRKQV